MYEAFCSSYYFSSSSVTNSWCCDLILLSPTSSFIPSATSSSRWGLDNGNFSEGALSCSGLLLWWFVVMCALFDSSLLLLVSRVQVLVLSRSDFKNLCTRCFHHDTLLPVRPVRAFPELKCSPVLLLLSPLDMYALIKAWRQDKFCSPLLDLLAFLTFGDMNTNKLKRPWRGVRQAFTINVAWDRCKKLIVKTGTKTRTHANANLG